MELQQFVAETLRQIIEGVEVAGKHAVQHGGKVNPQLGVGIRKLGPTAGGVLLQNVEFDVALTATEGKSTAGGVGVFFGPMALGSKGQSETTGASLSRIKFVVPLVLPAGPHSQTDD